MEFDLEQVEQLLLPLLSHLSQWKRHRSRLGRSTANNNRSMIPQPTCDMKNRRCLQTSGLKTVTTFRPPRMSRFRVLCLNSFKQIQRILLKKWRSASQILHFVYWLEIVKLHLQTQLLIRPLSWDGIRWWHQAWRPLILPKPNKQFAIKNPVWKKTSGAHVLRLAVIIGPQQWQLFHPPPEPCLMSSSLNFLERVEARARLTPPRAMP